MGQQSTDFGTSPQQSLRLAITNGSPLLFKRRAVLAWGKRPWISVQGAKSVKSEGNLILPGILPPDGADHLGRSSDKDR
jgi:hypothetical protein